MREYIVLKVKQLVKNNVGKHFSDDCDKNKIILPNVFF